MAKTLVIAEKPSVARDLAAALPGAFKQSQDKTHLVGDEYVITWAVGHLVGLAEPDAYDPKLKKWRFADLPILPDEFKLVPNDDKAKKQLRAIHKLIRSDEIERIVNACDAGREPRLPGRRQGREAAGGGGGGHRGGRGRRGAAGQEHKAGGQGGARGRDAPLRPPLAEAPREHPRRLPPPPHPGGGPEAVR